MSCGRWKSWHRVAAVVLLGLSTSFCTISVRAKGLPTPAETVVAAHQLPGEARAVMALIHRGGPFRYEKDGTVFGNRERLLPQQHRGYYREYTVKTPREPSRGARRIVCGGVKPVAPEACYYTDDHYASFRRIVQ